MIADRNFPQFLVGLHVLNIGFDEGMEVPHLCYECMLTLDNTIQYLICRRSRAGVIGVLFRLFLVHVSNWLIAHTRRLYPGHCFRGLVVRRLRSGFLSGREYETKCSDAKTKLYFFKQLINSY